MNISVRYKILSAIFLFSVVYLYLIHRKLTKNTEGVFSLVESIYQGLHTFLLFIWVPIVCLIGFGLGTMMKNDEVKAGFLYSCIGSTVFYILVMMLY